MTWLRPLLLSALLGPFAVHAEPLAGANDPQFHSLMTRLLAADDPAAIVALHDLAATNAAALIALPVAESWFPIAGTLQQRTALRQIDGKWVEDLAQTTSPPAALWQGGAISQGMPEQLTRALALYDAGEVRKADALLQAWFNHMPEGGPLPPGFADLPAAAWIKAMVLEAHVARGDRKSLLVLQDWLDQDRIEGWMVLSAVGDYYDGQGGKPLVASLKLGPNTGARLKDGRAARKLLWQEQPPPPLPPATVRMVMQDLMPRPQFGPVRAYCTAHCPNTAPACEAAFVATYGQPYHTVARATPLQSVMSESDFFASPRGEQILLGPATIHRFGLNLIGGYRGPLADHPAFQATETLDACLAKGILRAMQPLPDQP
ncbi:MAG: hypothetical protein ABIV25_09485 [Paracoccaceae bacterium]